MRALADRRWAPVVLSRLSTPALLMRGQILEFAQSAAWCARVVLGFYVWLLLGVAFTVAAALRLRALCERISNLGERALDWGGS